MNKQFKIWPVLRDVIIVTVLSGLGGFIVGFASTSGHDSPLYIYSLALSNSLFCIIGFTISGCLAVGNRWRHLAIVAAIVWAVSIFNVIFFEFTIIKWAVSAIGVAIFALIGGGISLLFKRKSLVEISSNAGDEKLYEEVARELQEKSMVPGLWTKVFAEMGGDDAKARALYIKYRVAQLAEASRQQLEKDRLARPQQVESISAIRARYIKVILAVVIVVATILAVIIGVMTNNKNFNANSVANDANTSAVTPAEQLPAVQTPADSEFDRQKILAEKGDADAQADLGVCYYKGWGVKQDYVEAVKWFRKAADQGNASAQNNLGSSYATGIGVAQDSAEEIKWYRKSADQNFAGAQLMLGNCYTTGEGVPKDEVEAAKWYRKAAEQGDDTAQNNLGRCYILGNGVPQDFVEAVKWHSRSAEQNNAFAQLNLGWCYANGQGVETNLVEAYKWFNLAAAQNYANGGNTSATNKRDTVAALMTPDQIAEAQRLSREFRPTKFIANQNNNYQLFEDTKAKAEKGDMIAQYNLGMYYWNGQVVIVDGVEAKKWFRKAAEQGYSPAQRVLESAADNSK